MEEAKDKVTSVIASIKDHRRSFSMLTGEDLYINSPTAEDVRKADWHYSKIYNQALMAGVTTAAQMYDILKERKIIGADHEKRGEELRMRVAEKMNAMTKEEDLDKREALAREVASLREDLFQWNQRVGGPMSNTCEQLSEDAKIDFLTAAMIEKKDGSRIWGLYDDYINEKDQALALRSRFEVLLFMQGLDSNFLEKTPENITLKEIAESRREAETERKERLEELLEEDDSVAHKIVENSVQPEVTKEVPTEVTQEKKSKKGPRGRKPKVSA